MDFSISLLPTIEHFHFLGYWIVLFVFFLESLAFVGITIPGTVFIVSLGFLSAKGFFNLGDIIWFVVVGAIAGDVLSYYLGRHVKKIFKNNSIIFKSKYLDKGKSFFSKYGGRSIFLGRFVGPIRPIVPFVAGMSKMGKKEFLLWNIFSCFAWTIIFLLAGFFFGQAWNSIAPWSARGTIFIILSVAFLVVFYILKRLTVKKGKQFFSFLSSVWLSAKEAVVNNSDVQKLTKKHDRLFKFIRERFDKSKFSGLPTTLLVFTFIYTLFLFVGVVEDVITTDTIVSVDVRVTNLLSVFRNVKLTGFFLWVTLLGKWQVISVFSLALIILLWLWRRKFYIIPLLLTIIGSEIFTGLGKIVLHRPRPQVALYIEHSFSFPSGHATIAIAFYGFLIYILLRNIGQWKTKVNIFFIGLAIILLIGFSRLYLGVHYLSDVWGGYLAGTLWLIVGISIAEWLYLNKRKDALLPPRTKAYLISVILILLSLISYALFAINYHPQISQPITLPEKIITRNINDIFSDGQLKYTETLTGQKQEPLSFIIFADNDDQFTKAFINSGWFLADKVSIFSVAKLAKAAFLKQAYHQAPITPSFWHEQTHNFGFEKSTGFNNVRQRHHARFWKTNYITKNGKKIYIGTASLDTSIKWGITHKISPDIDTEREFIFNDLQQAEVMANFQKEQLTKPVLGENFSGDLFFTDGKVYLIQLK